MRSLRQFLDELTGIRLSATNVSLWNIQATVSEYARASLNDAITTFPVKVDVVAQSLPILPNGFVVLPKHTEQVIQVETVAYSLQSRRDVLHWEFRPTVQTALLYLRDSISGTVEVTLQYRQPIFPASVYVVSDSITAVSVSGAAIAHTWPPGPAFIELAYTSNGYLYREVALYNAVSPTGFSGLVRGVYRPPGRVGRRCPCVSLALTRCYDQSCLWPRQSCMSTGYVTVPSTTSIRPLLHCRPSQWTTSRPSYETWRPGRVWPTQPS